jgi:hypothetical protein
MSQGYRAINIHGEDLSAEKIYQTLSSGGYFEDDIAAADYVRGIMNTPIAGASFGINFMTTPEAALDLLLRSSVSSWK